MPDTRPDVRQKALFITGKLSLSGRCRPLEVNLNKVTYLSDCTYLISHRFVQAAHHVGELYFIEREL